MAWMIARRTLSMVLAVFTVLTVLFFGIRLGAGDPTAALQGSYATSESIEILRKELGLDKPIWEQYLVYLKGLWNGDLGRSLLNGQPVLDQLLAVIPYTLDLTIAGLLIGVIFGVPLGFAAAVRRNSKWDHLIRVISLSGVSIPAFLVGYFLIMIFVLGLGLFPVTGGGDLNDPISRLRNLFLPALSLGLVMTAYITRLTRTTVLEILTKDFIRTARAKGLGRRTILWRHVLRLSLVSIVTLVGLYTTITIGSSVVIEMVFSRTGVGRLIVGAVAQRDYMIVQGAIVFYAVFVGVVNLVIDVAYTFIDPQDPVPMTRAAEREVAKDPEDRPLLWKLVIASFSFMASLPRTAKIGAILVILIFGAATFSSVIATHDPSEQSMLERNQGFSAKHWFGTDRFGRDVYSRLVIGAQYTLFITLSSLLIAASIGSLIGLSAAYSRGGYFDMAVVWFVDVFMTFPTLILGVIIVAIFGQDLINVAFAIAIAFLPRLTRMARGVAMSVVNNDYVEAAQAVGASTPRIIVVHLLPNILSEMAVITTLWMGTAIQVETSLSFLGLGVQPPTPSWGLMIREGIGDLYINAWASLMPALAILITILGLNMLADGLQDRLNPATRER